MKWPLVRRSTFVKAKEQAVKWYASNAIATAKIRQLELYVKELTDALYRERDHVREEKWRRLRAEGLVAFKDDRIRKVIGLLPAIEEDHAKPRR